MKLVNLTTSVDPDRLLEMLKSSDEVNDKVKFDEKCGKPYMTVKEKGSRIRITCRMMGGATKDKLAIFHVPFVRQKYYNQCN